MAHITSHDTGILVALKLGTNIILRDIVGPDASLKCAITQSKMAAFKPTTLMNRLAGRSNICARSATPGVTVNDIASIYY